MVYQMVVEVESFHIATHMLTICCVHILTEMVAYMCSQAYELPLW